MTLKEYIPLAIRTECDYKATQFWAGREHFYTPPNHWRLAHAAIGISTECAELIIAINKGDFVNILEEIGDILWYGAIALNSFSVVDVHIATRDEFGSDTLSATAGHLLDLVKKEMFYGKAVDKSKAISALMTILSICASIARDLDTCLSDIMDKNIAKLRIRYPEKFTEHHAENRDLATELKVLS